MFFSLEQATTKTKILPKAAKNQFFNNFLIKCFFIRKSNHQNQDIAKSSKIQFLML